jgi:hypothetical protein
MHPVHGAGSYQSDAAMALIDRPPPAGVPPDPALGLPGRPVEGSPNEISKTAPSERSLDGITSLEQEARHSGGAADC